VLEYGFWRDPNHPESYLIRERYADQAVVGTHMALPAFIDTSRAGWPPTPTHSRNHLRPHPNPDVPRPAMQEAVMHKLVVLYSKPADPDHFRDYYVTNHLPLVMNWPGLLAWRYSFDVAATKGEAPYFAVFEADFVDAAAMAAARATPQGRRVAADVANYATGGAVIIHYPVQDGTG
jgi:uncharacterized protein (TIGR02118 family)